MKILPVVYVTKWALTRGILVFRNVPHEERHAIDGWVAVYINKWRTLLAPGDWTEDEKAAREQTNVMLSRAIVAAEKRLAKLSKFAPKFKEQS